MPDLEKVVKGLRICDPDFCSKERRLQCPYYEGPDTDYWGNPGGYICDYNLRHDAIDLLNSQAKTISNLQESLNSARVATMQEG